MHILVTGGAGFIGSNFIHYWLKRYPTDEIVNLDCLTYAGNIHNLDDLQSNNHYHFVHGDINNEELVAYLIDQFQLDYLVNFAAESHVDRSILHPQVFVQTNVQGTLTLLQVAHKKHLRKFLQVSTDEVYGSLGATGYFTEKSPLQPNSPYAASKAAADMLVRSYFTTYGLDVNITRCSNNYGPYQFPEKLIPLMVTNALTGADLPIYGTGENIRDWLYVRDHCRALDLVLHRGQAGEIYNIGGHNEQTNNQIVNLIIKQLGIPASRIKHVADRLGHDLRYAIDPQKIETELQWQPTIAFTDGMVTTIDWYRQHEAWWQPLKQRAVVK